MVYKLSKSIGLAKNFNDGLLILVSQHIKLQQHRLGWCIPYTKNSAPKIAKQSSNDNKFRFEKYLCNIYQQYALESVLYHYEPLSKMNSESSSKTSNKVHSYKKDLTISCKRSYIKTKLVFNILPKELKIIKSKYRKKRTEKIHYSKYK